MKPGSHRVFAAMLAGWAIAGSAAGTDAEPGHACASLSVVTLNIYHDRADWPARRPLIAAGLEALSADVIALQEVLQHASLVNQAEDLAAALGYRWWFASADPEDSARRYGNAILTRHRILGASHHRLRPLDDARTLAHVTLDVDGQAVDVYATHLHHTPAGRDIRARQVGDLLSIVAKSRDDRPSLLLGDFNATVRAPELAPLLEHYRDAFGSVAKDADSITTLNPHYFEPAAQRRIDHVFVERNRFDILEARRVLDRPDESGTWPSDHFGVYARFCLSPKPAGMPAGQ